MSYKVDPNRIVYDDATGIFIRAEHNGNIGSHDVATLDRDSFIEFLRSRDDEHNENVLWRENVILTVLGHEQISDKS